MGGKAIHRSGRRLRSYEPEIPWEFAKTRDSRTSTARLFDLPPPEPLSEQMASFGIGKTGLAKLFLTHPSLDGRIAALKASAG